MDAGGLSETVQIVIRSQATSTRVIRREMNDLYLDALHNVDAPVKPQQPVLIRWVHEKGLWEQPARIVEIMDPVPILRVHLEGRAAPVEPRATPRVRAALEIDYGLVSPRSEMASTKTWDVSAAGLRFVAPVEMWPGLELEVRLHLDGRSWLLLSRVVRVVPWYRPRDGARGFSTAVLFVKPPRAARLALEEFVRRERLGERRQTPG